MRQVEANHLSTNTMSCSYVGMLDNVVKLVKFNISTRDYQFNRAYHKGVKIVVELSSFKNRQTFRWVTI